MPPKKKSQKKRKLTYVERSERVAKERALRPMWRKIILAVRILIALVVLGSIGWASYTGQFQIAKDYAERTFFEATSSMGLNLENVFVEGAEHLSEEKIIATLFPEGIKSGEHTPLFALSITEMKAKLKTLGWVDDVDIERQLPDSLHIRIKERVPVVIWQRGKVFALVDRHGMVISEPDVRLYPGLPVMVGKDAPEHLEEIYTLLEQNAGMIKTVGSLVRVSGRRWNILFHSGTELKLPEDDLEQAFATLQSLQREKQILDRAVKVIDLRDAERVYVLPE